LQARPDSIKIKDALQSACQVLDSLDPPNVDDPSRVNCERDADVNSSY
jgi:hypothetical protein